MARGYGNKDWWHNYQIYRKKEIIFDNLGYIDRIPCFAHLPWEKLKKGDRIHLEIWAPDNHSRYLTKEQAREFVKMVEKIRPFKIKIIEEGDKIFAIVWYENKFQTLSALTILRYAGEDNWNTHYPIVPFVLKYKNKAHFLKLLQWGHLYVTITNVQGNFSGHAILYRLHKSSILTSSYLKKVISKKPIELNAPWSRKEELVMPYAVRKITMRKNFLNLFYEDIRS